MEKQIPQKEVISTKEKWRRFKKGTQKYSRILGEILRGKPFGDPCLYTNNSGSVKFFLEEKERDYEEDSLAQTSSTAMTTHYSVSCSICESDFTKDREINEDIDPEKLPVRNEKFEEPANEPWQLLSENEAAAYADFLWEEKKREEVFKKPIPPSVEFSIN